MMNEGETFADFLKMDAVCFLLSIQIIGFPDLEEELMAQARNAINVIQRGG